MVQFSHNPAEIPALWFQPALMCLHVLLSCRVLRRLWQISGTKHRYLLIHERSPDSVLLFIRFAQTLLCAGNNRSPQQLWWAVFQNLNDIFFRQKQAAGETGYILWNYVLSRCTSGLPQIRAPVQILSCRCCSVQGAAADIAEFLQDTFFCQNTAYKTP